MKKLIIISFCILIIFLFIPSYLVGSNWEYIFGKEYEYSIPEYSEREQEIIENVYPKILHNAGYNHPIYVERICETGDSIIVDIMPVDALRSGTRFINRKRTDSTQALVNIATRCASWKETKNGKI
jgi:hypothetical protein